MLQRKLDFAIVGAQKSGTSTLDALLRQHPQIQMATDKETHFFDDEDRDWSNPDYAALNAFFPEDDDDRLRGEATPITFYWRPAIRRLHAYNPAIKLIVLLRDPVARTFSHWRKEFTRNKEALPFGDAIRQGRERLATETDEAHRLFSYVERSLYGRQLGYLLEVFPRAQIQCEIFEEFVADQAAMLARLSRFLGVGLFPRDLPRLHRNRGRKLAPAAALSAADAAYLAMLFRDEIAAVEAFIGRPVPAWRRASQTVS